jgi:hypothetical protein
VCLALLLAGCGKHYWEAPNRGIREFSLDSTDCIKDATGKYGVVSESIYRACMRSRGWSRVQTAQPTSQQFRGPEDEDEFRSPPNPLSERAQPLDRRDPRCTGPTASRASDCR